MKFSATLYCTSVYIACLKAPHAIAISEFFSLLQELIFYLTGNISPIETV